MDEFKKSIGPLAVSGDRSISTMINFAERTGREAYYETMTRGHKVWNNRKMGLIDQQLRTLWIGTAKCAERSEKLFRSWRQGGFRHHSCFQQDYEVQCGCTLFITRVAQECDRHGLHSFDLLERMRVAAELPQPTTSSRDTLTHTGIILGIVATFHEEREHIWRRFQEGDRGSADDSHYEVEEDAASLAGSVSVNMSELSED